MFSDGLQDVLALKFVKQTICKMKMGVFFGHRPLSLFHSCTVTSIMLPNRPVKKSFSHPVRIDKFPGNGKNDIEMSMNHHV
jgi:hypothetical protein